MGLAQARPNNVTSYEDFHPQIWLISLSNQGYLHLSSFSLCNKCVNATIVVCKNMTILSDTNHKTKVSSREKSGNESAFVRRLRHKNANIIYVLMHAVVKIAYSDGCYEG